MPGRRCAGSGVLGKPANNEKEEADFDSPGFIHSINPWFHTFALPTIENYVVIMVLLSRASTSKMSMIMSNFLIFISMGREHISIYVIANFLSLPLWLIELVNNFLFFCLYCFAPLTWIVSGQCDGVTVLPAR